MTDPRADSAMLRVIRSIGERLGLIEGRLGALERATKRQDTEIAHGSDVAEEGLIKAEDAHDKLNAIQTTASRAEALAAEAAKAAKRHPWWAALAATLAGSGGALEVIERWLYALCALALGAVCAAWAWISARFGG